MRVEATLNGCWPPARDQRSIGCAVITKPLCGKTRKALKAIWTACAARDYRRAQHKCLATKLHFHAPVPDPDRARPTQICARGAVRNATAACARPLRIMCVEIPLGLPDKRLHLGLHRACWGAAGWGSSIEEVRGAPWTSRWRF